MGFQFIIMQRVSPLHFHASSSTSLTIPTCLIAKTLSDTGDGAEIESDLGQDIR